MNQSQARRAGAVWIGALMVAAVAGGGAAQAADSLTPSEPWHGGPVQGPNGRTAYCAIEARFGPSLTFGIGQNSAGEYSLVLGVAAHGGGAQERVEVAVDGLTPRVIESVALDANAVALPLGRGAELLERAAAGHTFTVRTEADAVSLKLVGFDQALNALRACAQAIGKP